MNVLTFLEINKLDLFMICWAAVLAVIWGSGVGSQAIAEPGNAG